MACSRIATGGPAAPTQGPVVLRAARLGREAPAAWGGGLQAPEGIGLCLRPPRDRGGPWFPVVLAIAPSAFRSSRNAQMEAWRMLVLRHHVAAAGRKQWN